MIVETPRVANEAEQDDVLVSVQQLDRVLKNCEVMRFGCEAMFQGNVKLLEQINPFIARSSPELGLPSVIQDPAPSGSDVVLPSTASYTPHLQLDDMLVKRVKELETKNEELLLELETQNEQMRSGAVCYERRVGSFPLHY